MSMKIVKLTVTLKNEIVIELEKKTMMLSILRLETKLLKLFKKNEAINMSERENLTKVKIKKSQEKYLNFANLAIKEICDDNELDMNDTNTMLHTCAKTQVKTHWERRFDKRNKFYRQNKIF